MKALRPFSAALLASSLLGCLATVNHAKADRPDGPSPYAPRTQAERDDAVKRDRAAGWAAGAEFLKAQAARNGTEPERMRADGSAVTTPMLAPGMSAATAKRLGDIIARHAAECSSVTWFGFCSHALPEVGFGPPSSSDGVDLLTLQKPDAMALALASQVESERLCTETPCGSLPVFVFVSKGTYPPADDPKGIKAEQANEAFLHPPAPPSQPWTAEDWREFWAKTILLAVLWFTPLVAAAWGVYLSFDAKQKFGTWPHDKHGRVRAAPYLGIALILFSIAFALSGNVIAQGVACVCSIWASLAVDGAWSFYKTTKFMASRRSAMQRQRAAMQSSKLHGSAGLQSASDLARAGIISHDDEE